MVMNDIAKTGALWLIILSKNSKVWINSTTIRIINNTVEFITYS